MKKPTYTNNLIILNQAFMNRISSTQRNRSSQPKIIQKSFIIIKDPTPTFIKSNILRICFKNLSNQATKKMIKKTVTTSQK